MGEASEKHPIVTRPKLRNIPLPENVLKCFLCHKATDKKLNDFHAAALEGFVFFACTEHLDAAGQMVQCTKAYLERLKKSAAEQESTTE